MEKRLDNFCRLILIFDLWKFGRSRNSAVRVAENSAPDEAIHHETPVKVGEPPVERRGNTEPSPGIGKV